jgi:hypothetical protein
VDDPGVGEVDHVVAGQRQVDARGAVVLEGWLAAVPPVTVNLDDEALIGPEEIDDVAGDGDVGLRFGRGAEGLRPTRTPPR